MILFRVVAPRGRQIGRHLKLSISSERAHYEVQSRRLQDDTYVIKWTQESRPKKHMYGVAIAAIPKFRVDHTTFPYDSPISILPYNNQSKRLSTSILTHGSPHLGPKFDQTDGCNLPCTEP
jgi:hypothetical protein